MKKNKIILLVALLVIIIVIAVVIPKKPYVQEVSMDEPVDIVSDFYTKWIADQQSEETDPYISGLAQSSLLSQELAKKIKKAKNDELDPVLCQSTADIQIATRRILETDEEVRILVTARDKELTGQALITLLTLNEGWYMDTIECFPGEFGEEREFTFDNEGFLVKGSTLESLNPESWYIIFEEDGQPGYSAPLRFDGESMCNGDVCAPDQFTDVTAIAVQGQMTEAGVEVKNLIFN